MYGGEAAVAADTVNKILSNASSINNSGDNFGSWIDGWK